MQGGRFRAAIDGRDSNEDVFDVRLGVLDEKIEIAVFGKDASVEQFKFGLSAATAAVFFDEKLVGKFSLRILVEHAHVAVGRSGIEIEVVLFHILAVIALISGQAEEAFFQDRITPVPERKAEAHHLVAIADSANAVFAPTVGARAGVVMREKFPSGAVGTVIFTDCAPLAFRKIGPPALPVFLADARFFEAPVFCRWDAWHGAMILYGKVPAMVAFFRREERARVRLVVPARPLLANLGIIP